MTFGSFLRGHPRPNPPPDLTWSLRRRPSTAGPLDPWEDLLPEGSVRAAVRDELGFPSPAVRVYDVLRTQGEDQVAHFFVGEDRRARRLPFVGLLPTLSEAGGKDVRLLMDDWTAAWAQASPPTLLELAHGAGVDRRLLVRLSCELARRVLHLAEDPAVARAVEAAEAWLRGELDPADRDDLLDDALSLGVGPLDAPERAAVTAARCAGVVADVVRSDGRAVAGKVARLAASAVSRAASAGPAGPGESADARAEAARREEYAAQSRILRAALPLTAVLIAAVGPDGPERPDPVG